MANTTSKIKQEPPMNTLQNKSRLSRSQVAQEILEIAKKRDCKAQVTIIESTSKDIGLRNGEIENLLTSTAISTGVRLFKDEKSTIVSFSGEDFNNLESKIDMALKNLQFLNQDPFKRLLNTEEFAGSVPSLDLSDQGYETLDLPPVVELLKEIEQKALAVSPKISPADMAEFSGSGSHVHLFTSEGVDKSYDKSLYTFSYVAVAEENDAKERDYWTESQRHFIDLPNQKALALIGEIAAQRALKRLGGQKISSGDRKVIFTHRTAATLLGMLCDAVDGEEIVTKNSFLLDQIGQQLFPKHVSIIDDPLMTRFPGSYPFDGEGMNGVKKAIVEEGKLTGYLHNSYSAGKLGMALTGNASRSISGEPRIMTGNFYLQSGKGKLEDLIREMKDGLVIEDMYTSGMNPVSGNFSFGCSGFLVEKGAITMPVREITVAGNLLELYQNIIAIADDNRWNSTITSPSIMVSKLSIGGI